jgi:hypothetical protein
MMRNCQRSWRYGGENVTLPDYGKVARQPDTIEAGYKKYSFIFLAGQ